LVDEYPLHHQDPSVTVTPADARRWLGIDLTVEQMADILRRLEFAVEVDGESLTATVPDHRLDIDEGVIGKADLMEEVARIYGYENIPETLMEDALPPQRNNPSLDTEERIRDILASLGMQEIINYRMTAPEREQRLLPPDVPADDRPYIELANPMAPDRAKLRKSVLASVLEIVEANTRIRPHIAVFEIGPIFLSSESGSLPDEFTRLSLALAGPRELPTWQGADDTAMDFYDLKGVVETLLDGLHIQGARYELCENPIYHPGKCARVMLGDKQLGVIGELHPLVQEQYNFGAPVQAGDFYLETILEVIPERYEVSDVAAYPPVLEDLAVVVDETLPAVQVEELILQTGGKLVTGVQLFDVYRGEQIGKGKKSLAYSITYQDPDRTLTDKEVAKQRAKIVRRLENELNAKLRM
ncbi:MAG: phenylalanine--tRNA ligase subunit beta, partial [Anaerolineales bacterium]|nr:phenylalanine--tRNA ligase subunit beta [Anaerolineales bacterium]